MVIERDQSAVERSEVDLALVAVLLDHARQSLQIKLGASLALEIAEDLYDNRSVFAA